MLHTHETLPVTKKSAQYPLSPITVEYNTDGSQVKSSHLILLERQHVIMRQLPGRSVPSPFSAQGRDNYWTCFSRANSEVPSPAIELYASRARQHRDIHPELQVPPVWSSVLINPHINHLSSLASHSRAGIILF